MHTLPGDRYGVAQVVADWQHSTCWQSVESFRRLACPRENYSAGTGDCRIDDENGHRRDMHPAEQIAGFRAMRRKAKHLHKLVICWAIHPASSANAETGRPCTSHPRCAGRDRITTEHCQALALENDTARQCRCLKPPASQDGAVNRMCGYPQPDYRK